MQNSTNIRILELLRFLYERTDENHPAIITELLWAPDFSLSRFWHNLSTAFLPFFSWNTAIESAFLAPLVGLGSVALAIVGLLSTAKGFFASRNSIASCLIVFTIFLAGFNPCRLFNGIGYGFDL